jgi:hypothetical protein
MSEGISLSVVLATIEPWPDLANCLAVLEPQVAAVGGEIIVGDGDGAALDAAKAAASDRLSRPVFPPDRNHPTPEARDSRNACATRGDRAESTPATTFS